VLEELIPSTKYATVSASTSELSQGMMVMLMLMMNAAQHNDCLRG
jgi:hypothetical protein